MGITSKYMILQIEMVMLKMIAWLLGQESNIIKNGEGMCADKEFLF